VGRQEVQRHSFVRALARLSFSRSCLSPEGAKVGPRSRRFLTNFPGKKAFLCPLQRVSVTPASRRFSEFQNSITSQSLGSVAVVDACWRSRRPCRLVRIGCGRAAGCARGKGAAAAISHRTAGVARLVQYAARRRAVRGASGLRRAFRPTAKRCFSASRTKVSSASFITVARSPLGSRWLAKARARSSKSRNSPSAVKCTPKRSGESGSIDARLGVWHGLGAGGELGALARLFWPVSSGFLRSSARSVLPATTGASPTAASSTCAACLTSRVLDSARFGNRRIDSRTSGFGKRAANSSSTWRRLLPLHSANSSVAFSGSKWPLSAHSAERCSSPRATRSSAPENFRHTRAATIRLPAEDSHKPSSRVQ
jgi:hypothetical protein